MHRIFAVAAKRIMKTGEEIKRKCFMEKGVKNYGE